MRYKSPLLLVIATYSLFSVDGGSFLAEKTSLSKSSSLSVNITQADFTVSPFEYDQFNAENL